jgi:hypothetical protein
MYRNEQGSASCSAIEIDERPAPATPPTGTAKRLLVICQELVRVDRDSENDFHADSCGPVQRDLHHVLIPELGIAFRHDGGWRWPAHPPQNQCF